MEAAAILALGLQDWIDAGVIIGILMLNAIVGWYQEKQAADVVASLKGDISMKARVIRDGHEQEIKARELVPGDIVSLMYTLWGILNVANYQFRSSSRKALLYPLTPDSSAISTRAWMASRSTRPS